MILARTFQDALGYAEASGWLANAWRHARDVHDVIGANKLTEVYVLPGASKAKNFPVCLRGFIVRGSRIYDLGGALEAPKTEEAAHG